MSDTANANIMIRVADGWLDCGTGEVTGTGPPPLTGFPTASDVGVPIDWTPVSEYTQTNFDVNVAGSVVEDIRVNGNIRVRATDVTLRRVEVNGGRVFNNYAGVYGSGMVLEDCTINGPHTLDAGIPMLAEGGYTARRCLIMNGTEGFRVASQSGFAGAGAVLIEDCYCQITGPDDEGFDWHGDGLQGFNGDSVTIRNSVIHVIPSVAGNGNAAFFYPADQGNVGTFTIDGLLCSGAGFTVRLGMPGTVNGLYIVDDSWAFGPTSIANPGLITEWNDVYLCTVDGDGQPVPGAAIPLT